MSPRDLTLAVIATLILGVNFVVVKVAVGYAPPVFVTALRFAFVSLALVWFFPPSKMPPDLWRGVLVFSVFQGLLHHGAMYIGIRGVDAAIGSIIMQLGTPFALLFAWWLLGEKFGWRRSMGLVVAFAGVIILIGEPDVWAASYYVSFLIISALCWGFVNAYVKRLGEVNILQLTAWYAVFAVPQLLIASAVFETGQWDAAMAAPLQFWALIGFMSFGATIMAYGIWYYLIGRYSMAHMVPFALLNPVIGAVSGIVLLGEIMTWEKIAGGVIVLVGVAIIQLRGKRTVSPNSSGD